MITAHFKNIKQEIINNISLSKYSLEIAVSWFTHQRIFDIIVEKCKEGVSVELICNSATDT